MSFDEQKIQEMIDKQITGWQQKIKERFDVGEIFPIEFQKRYPDKWKKVCENKLDLYKLIYVIKHQRPESQYVHSIDTEDLLPISNISHNSIHNFIRKILYLDECDEKELIYWKNIIGISYTYDYQEKDPKTICFGNINLCLKKYKYIYKSLPHGSTNFRYSYRCVTNDLLDGFVNALNRLNTEMQYKIIYNARDRELINLIHNLNYYEICCKILMNTNEIYLIEYCSIPSWDNNQKRYLNNKQVYTEDNIMFRGIRNIIFGN
jgi:hypothetical protein